MAVDGGLGDVKGHRVISSSWARRRGTSMDAEKGRQEETVPLSSSSRKSLLS